MMVAIRDGWPRGSNSFPCRRLASVRRWVCPRAGARGSPTLVFNGASNHIYFFRFSIMGEVGQGGSSVEDQAGEVVEGETGWR